MYRLSIRFLSLVTCFLAFLVIHIHKAKTLQLSNKQLLMFGALTKFWSFRTETILYPVLAYFCFRPEKLIFDLVVTWNICLLQVHAP